MKKFALVVGALAALGFTGCYSTPEGGEIGVVRNGGPFDNKNIRQIVHQGQGNTWVGWLSNTHYYPAANSQRIYKFDDAGDADAAPVVVPTKDGVRVRLTGTFYLNTAFDGTEHGDNLLEQFDTAFGTRTFGAADPDSDDALHPWEEGGWSKWFNSVLQPVIDSNLREVIGQFECRELVASCALVQRGGDRADVGRTNNVANIQRIQQRINESLLHEIEAKLGEPYFQNIRFSLGPVELPGVQQAIDNAQAAFAEVSRAQAKVEQAEREAQANRERQRGYESCPACARIDALRALPDGLQALGGDVALGLRP